MYRLKVVAVVVMVVVLTTMTGVIFAQDDNMTPPTPVVEIVGSIDSLDGETLILSGETFNIGSAYIDGGVTLVPGEIIEIYAELTADGLVVFLVDDVNAVDDDDDPAEITGTVEALDDTSILISGVRFNIMAATLEDTVNIGDTVEVYATLADGIWTAVLIELESDDMDNRDEESDDRDGDYELTGILETIGEGFIVVGGMTINTLSASFDDDVAPGEFIEVEFDFVNGERIAVYVDDLNDLDEDDVDYDIDYDIDYDDVVNDVQPTITAAQAGAIAQEVYPNATVVMIYLDMEDDVLVWEVELSNDFEFVIDATSGLRMEIYGPSNNSYYDDSGNRNSGDDSGNWNSGDDSGNWNSGDDSGNWNSGDDYDDDDDDDYDDYDDDDDDYDDD